MGLGSDDVVVYTVALFCIHYNDGIMGSMASQITSLTIVYSTVYSDADQRKHQSFASLTFVWGIHWWLVQRASSAENVSIWWRHHDYIEDEIKQYKTFSWKKKMYLIQV